MSEGAIIWGCGFCLSSVKAKTQIVQSKAKLAMRGKAIRLGIILLSSLLIFCLVSVELVEAGRLIENTSNDYTTPSPSDEIARPAAKAKDPVTQHDGTHAIAGLSASALRPADSGANAILREEGILLPVHPAGWGTASDLLYLYSIQRR